MPAAYSTFLTPEAALEIVLQTIQTGPTETVSHAHALNRVLAQDVICDVDLPPFDNSAMDGYAVVAADLQTAPARLTQIEIVGAGAVPTRVVERGTCLKIMTGAPLPQGADAVVMREETREVDGQIEFEETAVPAQNIRRAGSDVARGEVVLAIGTRVRAAQWAMLSALGQSLVEVYQQPRVAIVTTGDELVGVEAKLAPGQIRDSNGPALRALCESAGAHIVAQKQVGDTSEQLRATLDELAPNCDLILTSGGVSAGDFDPVRDVLLAEASVLFWKVKMKPGKPVMFALYRETPVLALPGNPASVMVTWDLFARPALLKRSGARALRRLEVKARLEETLPSAGGRVEFVRAQVESRDGELRARVSGDQGSGRLSTMTRANALLVIGENETQLDAGTEVSARLLECAEVE